jgi:O-antigen/teichoic acid export membrane protein
LDITGMSRSKRFLSGAALSYAYQASFALAAIWLTPFYLRNLGAHDYGVWLVGLQVLNFLLLCDLGVLAVLPRDVAHASGLELNGSDRERLPALIARTAKIVAPQTILVGLVALGLFFLRPSASTGLRGPVALVLFTFVITYPFRMFPAILQGLQDLTFTGQLRIVVWTLGVGLTVVLLLLGAHYYALAWGWCLQEAGANLGAMARLFRIRPDLLKVEHWKKAGKFHWRWLSRGLWVSVGQTTNTMIAGMDLLIIARFLGPATVVIYSCTGKLVQVLQNQPQSLASYALPGLSQMKASESRERIRSVATSLTQAMVLVGGAILCMVLPLNQQFVIHWTGAQFFGGILLTVLFLVNFIARLIDYTLALALFAFGYEKIYAMRSILDSIVSVGLACALVRPFGLQGVLLGFLGGALLVAIPMDLYFFAREFQVTLLDAARPYFPYLWRAAVVGGAAYALLGRIEMPNLVVVGIAAGAVGLVYSLISWPYVRRNELGGYILAATAGLRAGLKARLNNWRNKHLTSVAD